MKKTLIITLALVFVLGIAGTAFAANNPFVDVPANHWSYNAVSKLAQDGIVDGYGDGTFRGDKTMTRYEMAQIVAKAMAKSDKASAEDKALVDKLAVEFNAELQNLGVRVAKLEANQSKVKIGGDARIRYDNLQDANGGSVWKNRLRVTMTGDINDKVSMYSRYVYSDTAFGTTSAADGKAGATNRLADLAFTFKQLLPSTNVTVGRYTLNLGPTNYIAGTTGNLDGVETNSNFGKTTLKLGYADASYWQTTATYYAKSNPVANGAPTINKWQNGKDMKDIYYGEADYAFDKNVKINVNYLKNQKAGVIDENYDIFGGGIVYKFANNWKLTGEYYKNSADGAKDSYYGDDPKAIIGQLYYKGANIANPGSWGAFVEYAKFEGHVLPYAMQGPYTISDGTKVGVENDGIKFWDVQFVYTLAKNVNLEGVYQFNIKNAKTGDDAPSDKYTRVNLNFFF